MRILNKEELNSVNGAGFIEAMYGAVYGAAAGTTLGFKWGNGGTNWIMGATTQVLGFWAGGLVFGGIGFFTGMMSNSTTSTTDKINAYLSNFGMGSA